MKHGRLRPDERTAEEDERIKELLARRRRQLNDEGWVENRNAKSPIGNLSRLYGSRKRAAKRREVSE